MSVNSRRIALIALGANLPSATGTPMETLREALRLIADSISPPLATARWRRTPAFPKGSGPDFVNSATMVETALEAVELLQRLHAIEAQMGRTRDRRWEPRLCDLDLIAFGDEVAPAPVYVNSLMSLGDEVAATSPPPDQLVLPHPRLHERAFVLAPLADIAPDWQHPLLGRSVLEMLADLPQSSRDEIEVIDV